MKCGSFDFANKLHEQRYHLLLTETGEAFSLSWPPMPGGDCVERAMACAGYRYVDGAENAFEVVTASIDAGRPALGIAPGGEWMLLVGYDEVSHAVFDSGGTAHPADGSALRAVAVTGFSRERPRYADLFLHWAARLRDGFAVYDHANELLDGPPDDLREAFMRLHAFFGLLAENRCFAAMALLERLYGSGRLADGAAHALWAIGGFYMEIHDDCWRAWATMGGNHIPDPERNANRLLDPAVRDALHDLAARMRRFDGIAASILEKAPGAPFLRPDAE